MHWEIQKKLTKDKQSQRRREIIQNLLNNRGIKGRKKREEFFHPPKPESLSPRQVGINSKDLIKAISRIKSAIKNKEAIVVYGDYDADGICATAILWETLYAVGAQALPFIPHRETHGYGLSIKGINDILESQPQKGHNPSNSSKPSLIITVDNGIVAHEAVNYAKSKGIDVIVSDHHEKSKKLPKAFAIVHTTELAGAGVAWIFAKEIINSTRPKVSIQDSLDLATIGTLADMVPILDANRSIVKHGLKKLQTTRRIGLLKMFEEAVIDPAQIETYHISFMIAPRLNAMGRLEHAIDSLRLLCIKNQIKARELAKKISSINRQRQKLTEETLEQAKSVYLSENRGSSEEKIIIIDHQEFHEGVIGLIAGRMVEKFYRPTIVLARGEKFSKASARSVSGFNIIEAIRKTERLLIDAGGHPMAAGFTIESSKISSFKTKMRKIAQTGLPKEALEKKLTINCEIKLSDISWQLYKEIEKFEPFGIKNPKPVFALKNVQILEAMSIGSEGKHLKLFLPSPLAKQPTLPALWFNNGELANKLPPKLSLAFTLDENIWRNKRELQLKVKDIEI